MKNKVSLSHLGISVYDFDKMVDFYTRVMGLIISDAAPLPFAPDVRIAFLTSDPTDHHQLVIVAGRKAEDIPTDPPFGGSMGSQLFQVSFRLADLATMRTMQRRIADEGLTNVAPMNHGNAWALYVRDPEGNAIELFVDSPWYVAQPCGLPLDLSKTDAEILAETEAYCKAQPECVPATEWHLTQAVKIAAAQAALV
jgi:catechol 2,3-dioxygenase